MENDFWQIMRQVKVSLCILITKFAEESEHYEWLFKHKEVTNFYIRRKLAMMMLLEVEDNEQDQYYMLIDRSKLLVDSFEYIAKLKNIPGSFFGEFKEEQAIGLGVLREWFLLASQEIFNPNNALFVACPDYNRSFFPNQASEVNLLHLEYFRFSGRMTVLALAYYLQIRVGFDRVIFLQLDGNGVLLKDIRDVDPFLYRGCKEILNMDA
uniref:HECT-type E3 ubiquitin transferase n=2 Tax=Solanum tuberosum TaxID=4113 RepID=M1DTD2_SOLTU